MKRLPVIPQFGTPVLRYGSKYSTNNVQTTSKPNKIDIEIKKKNITSSGKNADLQDLKTKIDKLNKIYNIIFKHVCMKKQNFSHDMYTGVDNDLRKLYPEYDSKEFCLGDMSPLENPPTGAISSVEQKVAQAALEAQRVALEAQAVALGVALTPAQVAQAIAAVTSAQTALVQATAAVALAQAALVAAQAAQTVAPSVKAAQTVLQAQNVVQAAQNAQQAATDAQQAATDAQSATQVTRTGSVNTAARAVNTAQLAVQATPVPATSSTIGTCVQPMFEKAKLNALIDNFFNNNYIYKTCSFRDANNNYPVNVTIKQGGGNYKNPSENNYIDLFCILKSKPLKVDRSNDVYENTKEKELHNFSERWKQERDMFRNVAIDLLLTPDVNKQIPLMTSSSHLLPSVLLDQKEYNDFFQLYKEFKETKNRK